MPRDCGGKLKWRKNGLQAAGNVSVFRHHVFPAGAVVVVKLFTGGFLVAFAGCLVMRVLLVFLAPLTELLFLG
jgi:hypothetical protein